MNDLKLYQLFQVSRMRNRGTLHTSLDDDRASNDSPKISFRWEAESCSSISSAYTSVSGASSFKNCSITLNSTAIHEMNRYYPRKGSWITTDSECKILIPIFLTKQKTSRTDFTFLLCLPWTVVVLELWRRSCNGFINCLICLQYKSCRFYAKPEDFVCKKASYSYVKHVSEITLSVAQTII